MQEHLKERLTGAAILVIVVVLLVPELFRGPPNASPKESAAASAGPPLRSYTIDLRDTVAPPPPGVSAPVQAMPATGPASNPIKPPPKAPASAATSAPAAHSAPPSAPVTSTTQPLAAAPALSKPRAAAASPGAHAGAAKSGWTVQVGSFARRDYAERMAKQVTVKGYAVEVAGPDDHGLFRVRSAALPERAAAMALKQKMQASGLKPIVNTVP